MAITLGEGGSAVPSPLRSKNSHTSPGCQTLCVSPLSSLYFEKGFFRQLLPPPPPPFLRFAVRRRRRRKTSHFPSSPFPLFPPRTLDVRVAKEERRQAPSEFGPACVVEVPDRERLVECVVCHTIREGKRYGFGRRRRRRVSGDAAAERTRT